jgi:LysM repeat protein
LLALFVIVSIPAYAHARNSGIKISRTPEVVEAKNSQTMTLLEGHANTEPVKMQPKLAIVDNTALTSDGDITQTYLDSGVSGTGEISVYIVRKGDTLASIAKMFGVSTNTILWANNIKGNKVSEGDELVILPITGVKHTVKKGDTIKSIAAKYKADLDDILAYNDLTINSTLTVGDIVLVPDGEITSTPVKTGTSATPSYSGYYIRPINGGKKTQGIHGHNGVDLANSIGTPVMASAAGKVIVSKSSGYNGGYGTYVVISHGNGTQTLYGHLSRNDVSVGQTVSQGQVFGALGNTGKSTGPHLHFEVRGAKNPF